MPQFLNDQLINDLLADAYGQLLASFKDRNHGFHHFCFINTLNNLPFGRVVILRDFDAGKRQIVFHTDMRSPKCAQIVQNSASSAVFYDQGCKMQLVFTANATLHYQDDLATQRWLKTDLYARKTYLKLHAPGALISQDDKILPDHLIAKDPGEKESELGFANFAVVTLHFNELHILKLHHKGNEAFGIIWQNDKAHGQCIAP